jgi:hypothetical protein
MNIGNSVNREILGSIDISVQGMVSHNIFQLVSDVVWDTLIDSVIYLKHNVENEYR